MTNGIEAPMRLSVIEPIPNPIEIKQNANTKYAKNTTIPLKKAHSAAYRKVLNIKLKK